MKEFLLNFLKSKAGKRASWTLLNSLMAMIIAFLAYLASSNIFPEIVTYVITAVVLPFAQSGSQALTRYFNTKPKADA